MGEDGAVRVRRVGAVVLVHVVGGGRLAGVVVGTREVQHRFLPGDLPRCSRTRAVAARGLARRLCAVGKNNYIIISLLRAISLWETYPALLTAEINWLPRSSKFLN